MILKFQDDGPLIQNLGFSAVCRQGIAKLAPLTDLAGRLANPKARFYHYFSLAKKKIGTDSFVCNSKRFLYGFKALLCARWVVDFGSAPPVTFSQLVDRYLTDEQKDILGKLLDEKLNGGKGDIQSIDDSLIKVAKMLYVDLGAAGVEVLDLPAISDYEQVFVQVLVP
ncbi:DNA polymerase beta superfamily protein [Microbulbifer sp. 2205BS26-8]|uniref:DNA polymerase beta superfamily protein n=1 Tax=Microbulbifer sp. 2205BS26-8 TaxID=3064386 RepID=UPI00273EF1C1|nr:nucleotidyltransferase domain-containing protein [Microbulbifer sp. 2205BS26-8]MDP5209715.1 nucleotidyltransferase domain-containing protein [Microbulbifer sp. 2205BS26-8]